jgi:hypothetical protein
MASNKADSDTSDNESSNGGGKAVATNENSLESSEEEDFYETPPKANAPTTHQSNPRQPKAASPSVRFKEGTKRGPKTTSARPKPTPLTGPARSTVRNPYETSGCGRGGRGGRGQGIIGTTPPNPRTPPPASVLQNSG